MALHCWTSARYTIPLPEGHRFPIEKYALLREAVIGGGMVPGENVHEPARATVDAVRLVHAEDYVQRVVCGQLTDAEQRRIGLPWSEALAERSFRSVAGTCEATEAALRHGIAMNLAGGTHHAFPDHGEGFCVFNDVAIAIRLLQKEGRIRRAVVIDLDVHQGNGTHAVFARDPSVFTFSMHGARNYPYHKVAGTLDIGLPDGVGDEHYLDALGDALPRVLASAAPDVAIYLAGADPHEGDRLGRLGLTFDGLARRDAMVLDACREVGIPVAITIAGGYGRDIADSVRVHLNTVRVAAEVAR